MIWTVIFSGIGIIFTTIGIFTYAASDSNCTTIINDYNNGNIIKETRIIGNDTMYVYKYR